MNIEILSIEELKEQLREQGAPEGELNVLAERARQEAEYEIVYIGVDVGSPPHRMTLEQPDLHTRYNIQVTKPYELPKEEEDEEEIHSPLPEDNSSEEGYF